jgi:hypothetical protein
MRKVFFGLFVVIVVTGSGFGQSNPPLKVREVDGTPTKSGISTLVVSNGSLTVSGTTATVTTGVSGLSDVSGTLVSSSNFRVPDGGTSSATPLQIGFAGTGLYTTGGLLAVASSNIPTMAWNGANGNTHVNGSYQFVFGSSGFSTPDVGFTRSSAGVITLSNAASGFGTLYSAGVRLNPVAFTDLASQASGTVLYCSDCKAGNPCSAGTTGALAIRRQADWACF